MVMGEKLQFSGPILCSLVSVKTLGRVAGGSGFRASGRSRLQFLSEVGWASRRGRGANAWDIARPLCFLRVAVANAWELLDRLCITVELSGV